MNSKVIKMSDRIARKPLPKYAIFSLNPWYENYVINWMNYYGIAIKSIDTNSPDLLKVYKKILYVYNKYDEVWDINALLRFFDNDAS